LFRRDFDMNQTKKTQSAASFLRPSTLVLAAVIALEVLGMRTLPAAGNLAIVAAADGSTVYAQGASDVRVVAQADTAAR
jgi:hypothetical protein